MRAPSSSKRVVYAALLGNLLVALVKFGAAWWTGSSAMLSEAIHSLVDTSNQGMLLYGIHRAALPPDDRHPLGYGRELYFWSFIVALQMFMLGAGVTFYEGLDHVRDPHPIVDPFVSYIVLGCAALFEGTTFVIALRNFRKAKGDLGYFEAAQRSKDPPAFIVLFEDSAALIGIAIALLGTLAADRLALPALDGVASIGISLVLAATAIVLARESKELLIGEPASPRVAASILDIVRQQPGVERANLVFTIHLAPDQIVVALSVEFSDSLTTSEIEERIVTIERAIREAHSDVFAVFIKPQTAGVYQSSRRRFLQLSS
jgi:cation diffusion facilitator family transporter